MSNITDRRYYPTLPDQQVNKELQLVWDQIHQLNGHVKALQNKPAPQPPQLTGDVQLVGPSPNTVMVTALMGFRIKAAQPANGQVLTYVEKDSQIEWV